MLNMALLPRVVNESENMVVHQVVEEVNPPVEVGFDICGTTPIIGSNRRCSSVMETQLTIHHRS